MAKLKERRKKMKKRSKHIKGTCHSINCNAILVTPEEIKTGYCSRCWEEINAMYFDDDEPPSEEGQLSEGELADGRREAHSATASHKRGA